MISGQDLVKIMSGSQMRLLHAAMDTDNDKMVTQEEGAVLVREFCMSPMLRQTMPIMTNMDANNDELLSLDEFKEDLKHMKMEGDRKEDYLSRFAEFDDNGDGLLSIEEAMPLFSFMFNFQRLDTNTDGMLTIREFRQAAAAKLKNAPPEEVQKSKAQAKAIFAELDADGDKRLNAKEHFVYHSGAYAGNAAWGALFKIADSNADNRVSPEEITACREHQEFGGSAAYHHSKSWISMLEEAVKQASGEPAEKAEL